MQPDEDVQYRKAVSKYSASFMSNAKWLELFRAVIGAGVNVERAEWRFIDSPQEIWVSFPSEKDLLPTRFADGKFQPFEYRWIESIHIPRKYKPIEGVGYEREQDIENLVSALSAVGQFQLEVSADGVRIYAYQTWRAG